MRARTTSARAVQMWWPRAIGLSLALGLSLVFWLALAWSLRSLLG